MAELWNRVAAYRPTGQYLRYIAAGLAYLVAGLHIFHPELGFLQLVTVLTLDDPLRHLLHDPRPLLFVLSGISILIGIQLVLFGFSRRLIYALGMLLMAVYFTGYFGWHLTGHGGFLPNREPIYHGLHPVEAVIAHLGEYAWARWTKVVEAVLFAVLAVLFSQETGD